MLPANLAYAIAVRDCENGRKRKEKKNKKWLLSPAGWPPSHIADSIPLSPRPQVPACVQVGGILGWQDTSSKDAVIAPSLLGVAAFKQNDHPQNRLFKAPIVLASSTDNRWSWLGGSATGPPFRGGADTGGGPFDTLGELLELLLLAPAGFALFGSELTDGVGGSNSADRLALFVVAVVVGGGGAADRSVLGPSETALLGDETDGDLGDGLGGRMGGAAPPFCCQVLG